MTAARMIALTPVLSHPVGEEESSAAGLQCREPEVAGGHLFLLTITDCCSLSHRMGEGQGEGLPD